MIRRIAWFTAGTLLGLGLLAAGAAVIAVSDSRRVWPVDEDWD